MNVKAINKDITEFFEFKYAWREITSDLFLDKYIKMK